MGARRGALLSAPTGVSAPHDVRTGGFLGRAGPPMDGVLGERSAPPGRRQSRAHARDPSPRGAAAPRGQGEGGPAEPRGYGRAPNEGWERGVVDAGS